MGCNSSRAANVEADDMDEFGEFDDLLTVDEFAALERERLQQQRRRLLGRGRRNRRSSGRDPTIPPSSPNHDWIHDLQDRIDIMDLDHINMDDLGVDLDRDRPGPPMDFVTPHRVPTAGGSGGDNNENNNGNNNSNSNGGPRTTLSSNGEQLDQLRSDLVNLERLFHTLLGQQFPNGPGTPAITASSSNSCPPAANHVIENLPTISISKYDFEDDCNNNRECSICFLEHEVDDTVTRLPCGHFFHGECINEWLRKRCTCPICRWELETDDRLFELERVERMKSRRIRVKDHELDRLCIGGLQEMAGMKNVKNRAKLIKTIKNSKDIDIITKDRTRPQSHCKESKVKAQEEKEEIRKKIS